MIIHTFNTGHLYTERGQRIAWTVLASGHIAMYDVDRGIDYILQGLLAWPITDQVVLEAYDARALAPFSDADLHAALNVREALIAAAKATP